MPKKSEEPKEFTWFLPEFENKWDFSKIKKSLKINDSHLSQAEELKGKEIRCKHELKSYKLTLKKLYKDKNENLIIDCIVKGGETRSLYAKDCCLVSDPNGVKKRKRRQKK